MSGRDDQFRLEPTHSLYPLLFLPHRWDHHLPKQLSVRGKKERTEESFDIEYFLSLTPPHPNGLDQLGHRILSGRYKGSRNDKGLAHPIVLGMSKFFNVNRTRGRRA